MPLEIGIYIAFYELTWFKEIPLPANHREISEVVEREWDIAQFLTQIQGTDLYQPI